MQYYIGWDVGGWHCDTNPNSRDSLAVLVEEGEHLALRGEVSRGNIREEINEQQTLAGIINSCCATVITPKDQITIAIDTPLGLPSALISLATKGLTAESIPADFSENVYLYRQTERWLFEKGFSPMSAIMHMIGSQATKGIHLLSKLSLKTSEKKCGIWSSARTTAIETYPAPCMGSRRMTDLYSTLNVGPLNHEDKIDAVYCALVAYLFATDRTSLVSPQNRPLSSEGWIWIPDDVVTMK